MSTSGLNGKKWHKANCKAGEGLEGRNYPAEKVQEEAQRLKKEMEDLKQQLPIPRRKRPIYTANGLKSKGFKEAKDRIEVGGAEKELETQIKSLGVITECLGIKDCLD